MILSSHVSSMFLVVKPNKIFLLLQNTITKRRIESYSVLGTIVSPNKILLMCSRVYVNPKP